MIPQLLCNKTQNILANNIENIHCDICSCDKNDAIIWFYCCNLRSHPNRCHISVWKLAGSTGSLMGLFGFTQTDVIDLLHQWKNQFLVNETFK